MAPASSDTTTSSSDMVSPWHKTIALDGATQRLAGKLFRTIRHTFINRGLCQQRKDGSIREVGWIGWIPWFERRACAFVLDTGPLPASLEKLTDPRVVHQVSIALSGRPVEVTNHRGVLWTIGMDLPPLTALRPRRRLARSWERRGWLTPFQVGRSRQIADSLLAELEGTPGC